ncbi:hypothetical protein [Streptomyces sp. MBT60]|uniref:Mom family adenine methylcarbamoylation protein n=1 Tax=Streptomyces sp. MBT60 TaxID=2800409 RepID=UPI001909D0AF|nr:hypothetical protein [Streptomyces sp. MBT60]MBK3545946.1 hypothetical protein [Streptomyces sp. MBT60]
MKPTATIAKISRPLRSCRAFAEIPNASDRCQRWQGRRHSFRHVSEGGFDARRYAVEAVPEKEAKEFVVGHHYSGSFPSARIRFGLYDIGTGEARLCGVAVFGVPMRADVLTLPLPDLQPSMNRV